jgi:hypothetical protein
MEIGRFQASAAVYRDPRPSGMLRTVGLQLVTDVSGEPVVPILVGMLDPRRWDRQTVPKYRYPTTNQLCRKSQKEVRPQE